MRSRILRLEPLERRELLAGLWDSSPGEGQPVQAQEGEQVQACVGEGAGPVQEGEQTQTQTQQQGSDPAQVQQGEQTQEQTQSRTGDQEGDADPDGSVTDAAIESFVADNEDPPRTREANAFENQDPSGHLQRPRDRDGW
jgi:hypothetical protein